ncbi:MAG: hypothetical protein ACK56I_01305, partial [bacterium]
MREVARFSHGFCIQDKPNFVDKVPMPAVVEAILLMRFPIFLHEQFQVKISLYAKQQNKYRT